MAWFPWFMFGNWAYTETYMIHSKGYIYISLIQKCWLQITSYHIIWQNVVDINFINISSFIWSLISRFVDSSIPLFLPSFFCIFCWFTLHHYAIFLGLSYNGSPGHHGFQYQHGLTMRSIWNHHPSAGPLFQPSLRSSWLSPAGERRVASLPEQVKRVKWVNVLEVENSDIDAIQTSGTKKTIRNRRLGFLWLRFLTWDSLRNCVAMGFLR